MSKVALCAESECLQHPSLLGLDDVDLDSLDWLVPLTDGEKARSLIKSDTNISEAWVASCGDISAINLAAALRADNPDLNVYMVSSESSGSMMSRAQSAGINGVLSLKGFAERFAAVRKGEISVSRSKRTTKVKKAKSSASDEIEEKTDDAAGGMAETVSDIATPSIATSGVAASDIGAAGIEASDVAASIIEASDVVTSGTETSDMATSGIKTLKTDVLCSPDLESTKTIFKKRDREQCDRSAFVMSILSGSGGVGRSTVSVISAKLSAMQGAKTLLLDFDLRFGDVMHLAGSSNAVGINDVMESPELLVQLADMASQGDGLAVIGAPTRLEQAENLYGSLMCIVERADPLFDVIVVNTGVDWSEAHIALLERCDSSVFIVDQRASSIKACQHALDLCARLGIATGSFVYAVNHVERGALFTSIDIGCVMQGAHVYELKEGGAVVEELLGAGLLGELINTKNDLCESIAAMLEDILPSSGTSTKVKGFKNISGRKSKRRRGSQMQEMRSAVSSEGGAPLPVKSRRTNRSAGRKDKVGAER